MFIVQSVTNISSGLSDLPCHGCGARYGEESKIQNLASIPKPAASCWDGKIEGANDQMTMMRTIAGNIFENVPDLNELVEGGIECIIS